MNTIERFAWKSGDFIVEDLTALGGAGSGNFGHSGRPGEIGGSGSSGSISEERKQDVLYSWIMGHEGEKPGLYDKMRDPSTPEGKEFLKVAMSKPKFEGTVYRGLLLSTSEFEEIKNNDTWVVAKHSSSTTNQAVAETFVGGGSGLEERQMDSKPYPVLLKIEGTGRDFTNDDDEYPENEVVLLAGTRYDRIGEPKEITLEEYPDPVWQVTLREKQ